MTSKISYFKFIKENLKHRAWLVACSFIAQFLILPVYALMSIDNQKSMLLNSSDLQGLKEWANYNFSGLFNGSNNLFLAILLIGMGLICAVTGFSYLHSKVKQDFYHSMAITRTQWFLISYISGLLIFLVPFIVSSFCTILIGQVNGLMDLSLFLYCLRAILYGIMVFFLSYHTSILAIMLTGQIITSILASIVLFVYGSAIMGLLEIFCDAFLNTWFSRFSVFNCILPYSSPAALAANFIGCSVSDSGMILGFDGNPGSAFKIWSISLLLLIIMFVAALLLYRKYPSEAAENALSFPKTGGFIKVLIAIPSALAIGLFSNTFFGYNGKNHWLFIISILFVFLMCFIIEFIYHHDLKMILSGKISTGISLIGVLVILCVFHFDVFGYDSYLPKESALKSMSVYCYDNNNYYDYQIYNHDIAKIMEKTTTTDFHPFYELAKHHKSTEDSSFISMNENNLSNIVVRFDQKKGHPIYRVYNVEHQDLINAFESTYRNLDYRKQEHPIFNINNHDVNYFKLEDIYNTTLPLDTLTSEQKSTLLEAYKKDFLNADFNTLINENPIARLYVGYTLDQASQNYTQDSFESALYLYKDFSNTLSLLREYGCTIREKININDVIRMMYIPSEYESQTNDDKAISPREISDPKEMQDILDKLTLSDSHHLLDSTNHYYNASTVSVSLNTGYEIQFTLFEDK